jgi:hypothetical protein
MAKYTLIPETAFQDIQLNAGILLESFDVSKPTVKASDIIGATSGGVNITATPSFTDFGEDIDNCPANMMELKRLESWEIKASGTFVTVTVKLGKLLAGVADISDTAIKFRNDVSTTDFQDLWWVGDYSDKNGDENGGFVAVHLSNVLSTGGFQIQSTTKAKGTFEFEFTAHYSMADQTKVPIEVYIVDGADETSTVSETE